MNFFRTKSVKQDENGPVWMPWGHAPLGVIHFWGPLRTPFPNACLGRADVLIGVLPSESPVTD